MCVACVYADNNGLAAVGQAFTSVCMDKDQPPQGGQLGHGEKLHTVCQCFVAFWCGSHAASQAVHCRQAKVGRAF